VKIKRIQHILVVLQKSMEELLK